MKQLHPLIEAAANRLLHHRWKEWFWADGIGFEGLLDLLSTLSTGETVFLRADEAVERYPVFAPELRSRSLHTVGFEPLRTPTGSLLGALVVGWAPSSDPELAIRTRLAIIADLCEQTAERARLYGEDHRVVTGLLARIMPPLPHVAWHSSMTLGPGS